MKANFTHLILARAILFLLVLLYSLVVFGKPSDGLKNSQVMKIEKKKENQSAFIDNKSQLVFAIVKRY